MSEIKVKYPIKAPIAAKLKSLCSEFSKVIADNCDDFVIRARVFSDDNASIKMRVLMSDVDGSLFIATFVLQDNGDKLLVSNRFSPKGGYAGRRRAFSSIKKAFVCFLNGVNSVNPRITQIVFDLDFLVPYLECSYYPSVTEKGHCCIDVLRYTKDMYGISEMSAEDPVMCG